MESIKKFNEFTRNVNEKLFNNIEDNKILLEISRVGFISKSPVLEIYIHTDDPGNIPHFHIRDYKKNGNSGEEFHTCIEFKTNRYFHHTGKEDTLNKHQRKLLCDFLKKTEQDELEPNWNILIKEWNRNNSNIKIPTNLPMPDYTTIEENESAFDKEKIVYKTYFPKDNEDDYIYIRDNAKMLWDFFDSGYKYANLKEFRSCINPKSLLKNTSCLKVALFNDVMVAASVYTSFQGGMKCVGITTTTDEKYREIGKYAVIQIIKEDISLVGEFYWTECSDTIEHLYKKHGGIKIPNDYTHLFIKDYKELLDDGYHFVMEITYSDDEKEDIKKVIFGFNSKETFEEIKNKNDERIMTYINRITNITIKKTVYVKNLSKEDYYTEVVYVFYEDRVAGFKDYSNKTMNILKDAVEYLKKFVELNKNNKDIDIRKYSDAIENGEDLIASATIMDIHNDIII